MKFLISTMPNLPSIQALRSEMFDFINSFPVNTDFSSFQKNFLENIELKRAKKSWKKSCPVGYKCVTIAKA